MNTLAPACISAIFIGPGAGHFIIMQLSFGFGLAASKMLLIKKTDGDRLLGFHF